MSDVIDNAAERRFELAAEGGVAIAAYRREGDTLVFTHTEVPEALEGQGIGGRLIAGALAQVRARGETIVPACSFVEHYVSTHPDVQDLVAG